MFSRRRDSAQGWIRRRILLRLSRCRGCSRRCAGALWVPGRRSEWLRAYVQGWRSRTLGRVMEVRVAMYHLWWDEKVFGMADVSMWTM